MKRVIVSAVALVVATIGVPSARSVAPPSPVPASSLGHPGNPIHVLAGAFTVTGKAGTVAHVHLDQPLDVPFPTSARLDIQSTGFYGAVILRPDKPGDGSSNGTAMEVATIGESAICPGPCYSTTLLVSSPPNQTLAAGDYVLALAGPEGSTISYSLAGPAGDEPQTRITGLYALPYQSHAISPSPRPASDALAQTGRGSWYVPTIGRRMLAGVLLAAYLPNGGGYSYAICPGAYGIASTQNSTTSTAQPACSGYASASGGVTPTNPVDDAVPGGNQYANLTFTTASGIFEGVTGGSFAIRCDKPDCTFLSDAFVFALDS